MVQVKWDVLFCGRCMSQAFADCLRSALEERAMSRRHLAARIGVSKNTVTSWTTGVHEPGLAHLRQIADVLDLSVDELVRGRSPSEQRAGDELIERLAAAAPDLIEVLTEAQRRARRSL